MAKVAIVILNWNGQKMLAKYLPNVIEYSRQDAEIWVADNSSSDGSMHLLETQFPQVKTIVLEQNFGFAEGYNRALKQIDATYYVLLNSDVEVSHHWLTPLIEFMDSHQVLPAITLQFGSISEIFGGSVLVEQVFSYPGLGQAAIDAGLGSDVSLLLAITVISTLFVFLGNLAANVLYGVIDPQIRRGRSHG